jgi:hypothetical protein
LEFPRKGFSPIAINPGVRLPTLVESRGEKRYISNKNGGEESPP